MTVYSSVQYSTVQYGTVQYILYSKVQIFTVTIDSFDLLPGSSYFQISTVLLDTVAVALAQQIYQC